ncbi:MAG: UDP-2,4-diacetamido-2,4,6-trideoxy-beta-L-altropyranose hydrolase [Gammaproteobacteria bacterium]
MRFLFRADASVAIGSGHVMRCLTLAARLMALGGDVAFICREHAGHLCDSIEKSGFSLLRLPVSGCAGLDAGPQLRHAAWLGSDQRSDAQDVLQALGGGKADWLIVDHYALDWRWESLLRSHVGHIMAIDDIADRRHDCDVLLDQNLFPDMATRYRERVPEQCRQLLGPQYALLRDEFGVARQCVTEKDGTVKRLLVFMGGADAANATGLVLDALQLLDRGDLAVDVVVGGSNPHAGVIRQRCTETAGWRCHVQVSNLAEFMLRADFAVGAGGVSTWERCALGLPSAVIAVADNQTPIAREAANRGAAFFAGELHDLDSQILAALLSEKLDAGAALRAMSHCALRLVDAEGAGRVAQIIWHL